ncbi:MBL fold metallo-hydrolase [Paenibacillus sp. HWE-109]|uniref:MBL fold metallo-hydrolase n=1 Tax=Paenibacillus sp. HWE-109 TaxID=1306526 RepID=UPI001EDF556D|nr:MBL fold metallo-hydrolase [Paenibacillus sp. HWE-109]UKS27429.1 MBL fold metallo-hydrolase [Paenibacillus sp. HWE-109]
MMQLHVWGGAGEHGRSCYWIGNDHTSILLDCGVKREGCGEYPLLDPTRIARLDAVFLSHAHEDHSITIPWLYKMGYTGKVWTTSLTAMQLPGYFASWANYVSQQGGTLPYDEEDLAAIQYAYIEDEVPPLQWAALSPALQICWGRSGHMLGSIWLLIELEGKRLFYSGDYTEESFLLETDTPEGEIRGPAHLHGAIVDAAYSTDAEHQPEKLEQLYMAAANILSAGGQLLMPVPVSGRGQELLLLLRRRFPDTPIRVEHELIDAMELMLEHASWLKPGMDQVLADALRLSSFEIVHGDEQRAHLLEQDMAAGRAAIWFTNDGMMQSAKSQWYYEKLRTHAGSGILITGHVAKGTMAERLLGLSEAQRGCRMAVVRYKIHQGKPDVRKMTQAMNSKFTLLVHAPKRDTDILLKQLESEGYRDLLSLQPGDIIHL